MYAVRTREFFNDGRGDERWKLFEEFDERGHEPISEWPDKETAERAIPFPVMCSHNAYSAEFEIIKVGSRDHRRAVRNSGW